jgi:hypothetical protein
MHWQQQKDIKYNNLIKIRYEKSDLFFDSYMRYVVVPEAGRDLNKRESCV